MTAPCLNKNSLEDMPHGLKGRRYKLNSALRKTINAGRNLSFRELMDAAEEMEKVADGVVGDAIIYFKDGLDSWGEREEATIKEVEEATRQGRQRERELRSVFNKLNRKWTDLIDRKPHLKDQLETHFMRLMEGSEKRGDFDGMPVDISEFADSELREAIANLGRQLVESKFIESETLNGYLNRYYRHIWKRDEEFHLARRQFEKDRGFESQPGRIFGRMSAIDDGDVTAGRSITSSGSQSSPGFATSDEFRPGVSIPKGFTKRRSIEILPGDEAVSARRSELIGQADRWEKEAESLLESDPKRAEGLALAATEYRLQADKTITDAQARELGLEMDPRIVVKALFSQQGRAITSEHEMAAAVKRAPIFLSADDAKANGYATISENIRRSNVIEALGNNLPPSAKLLLEPGNKMGLSPVRREDGGWVIVDEFGEPLRDGDGNEKVYQSEQFARKDMMSARRYIFKPIADGINEVIQDLDGAVGMFQQATRTYAELKTTLSPSSHSHNFLGAMWGATVGNRYTFGPEVFGQKNIAKLTYQAFNDLLKIGKDPTADPATNKLFDDFLIAGIVQPRTVYDISPLEADTPPENASQLGALVHKSLRKKIPVIGKSAQDYRKFMRDLWVLEDSAVRFAIGRDLYNQVNPRTGEAFTFEEIANEVDRLLPNPDLISPAARKLTRSLPFFRFSLEMARIFGGHARRGAVGLLKIKDAKTIEGKDSVFSTGAWEDVVPLAKMAGTLAGFRLASELAMAYAGINEEDQELIRSHTRGIGFMVPNVFTPEDDVMFINTTASTPFGEWYIDANEDLEPLPWEGPADTALKAATYVPVRFVSGGLLSNPIYRGAYELLAGKKLGDFETEITGETDTAIQKAIDVAGYITEQYSIPLVFYGGKKMFEWSTKVPNLADKPKTTGVELLSYFTGVPIESVDPEEKRMMEYVTNKRLMKELQGDAYGELRKDHNYDMHDFVDRTDALFED